VEREPGPRGVEEHVVEPGLRAVEEPQTITARLRVEVRVRLAVDDRRVAEELGDPHGMDVRDAAGRIPQRPVVVERLVLDHDGEVVRPTWHALVLDRHAVVDRVEEQVPGGETEVRLQPRHRERMVVVPVERGRLVVRVRERVGHVVGAGRARSGPPLIGGAVELRGGQPAVEMRDRPAAGEIGP